jgi:hypothetical protein
MRSRPPKRLSPEKEEAAAAFIEAAEVVPGAEAEKTDEDVKEAPKRQRKRKAQKQKKVYPWQEPHVRDDVNQAFSIRLPEPLYLKLKYISDETGRSMNHMLKTLAEEMVEETLDDVL